MKRFLPVILIIILALFAFGCKKNKTKSADDLSNILNSTNSAYANAENVQAKITLTSDSVQTIDVKYSIANGKIASLATVLTDSEGEVSVYVKDGTCYVARYNSPKEKYAATDIELTTIALSYKLDAYIKKAMDIFNGQFFKASSVEKVSDDTYKLTCDVNSLQVADDVPDEEILEAEAQIEKLKAMDSITLVLVLNGDSVKELEGTFVKEGKTSKIKIEFLGTGSVEVSVPSASEYKDKE